MAAVAQPQLSLASSTTTSSKPMTTNLTTAASSAATILLPPAASLLDQLLENTKSLPRNVTGLGAIQLGISEIAGKARSLRSRAPVSADGDTKAHYLLAGSGINAEDIAQDLETISFHTTFESGGNAGGAGSGGGSGSGGVSGGSGYSSAAAVDSDIVSYLRQKREESIVASIEDSVRQTNRKFDAFVSANIRLQWNYEKLLVCEHFGLVPRGTAGKLAAELGISTTGGSAAAASYDASVAASEGGVSLSGESAQRRASKAQALGPGAAGGWKKSSLGRSVLGPISGSLDFADVGGVDYQQQAQQTSTQKQQPQQSQQAGVMHQMRQIRYAYVVHELNDARLAKQTYPLLRAFKEVVASLGSDTRSLQLRDSWGILENLVPADRGERSFVRMYCNQSASSATSVETVQMKQLIARSSRQFLEKQFLETVEADISKYPLEAELGGVPSVINKILAYVKLRFAKNGQWVAQNLEIINNVPIWALLYYLIRSGLVEEAVQYTIENDNYFQKIERTFPTYLKAYARSEDNELPRELAERLQSEFNHHIRNYDPKSDDPFKYSLYKLLGRCELNRKHIPEVLRVTEDWMWAQLMLVRDSVAAAGDVFGAGNSASAVGGASERYNLEDLQNMLVQLGARHFNSRGTNPMLYFQLLLLSGQYERAVHYVYKLQPVDAVHFAIALTYYGLLRPALEESAAFDADLLILNSKSQQPEINFARLIGYYTRDFRRTDASYAFDYLALLCLNGDLRGSEDSSVAGRNKKRSAIEEETPYLRLCHEAIREMVLETREFAVLLGDIRADGAREAGIIEQKMALINIEDEEHFLRTITEQAAEQADQDGRVTDAILLYHLSEEYDRVLSIINKTLGESLAIADLGTTSEGGDENALGGVSMSLAGKENPVQLAREVISVYESNGEIVRKLSPRNREACGMLLQIMDARRAYESGQWETCLGYISGMRVLPLELDNDTGGIRRRAQKFSELNENVARNVPMLLVIAMECCVRITREMDSSAFGDATRSKGDIGRRKEEEIRVGK
ncbi:Nup93/Nic96-domain-containing protein [Myxozyma melibiosi]|uniref:Nup93/Nic96-domain-containing protein n=1 Tax=Myxozyma melibiosi TaxID=54550 RepID=A0ABR1F3M9_9ASCO